MIQTSSNMSCASVIWCLKVSLGFGQSCPRQEPSQEDIAGKTPARQQSFSLVSLTYNIIGIMILRVIVRINDNGHTKHHDIEHMIMLVSPSYWH